MLAAVRSDCRWGVPRLSSRALTRSCPNSRLRSGKWGEERTSSPRIQPRLGSERLKPFPTQAPGSKFGAPRRPPGVSCAKSRGPGCGQWGPAAPLPTRSYREPEATGAPGGREAAAQARAAWAAGPGPPRPGARRWRRAGEGRGGGGGGAGAAAAADRTGVNKPRRRGPAAAPARAGARAQAEPCPGRRPGRGRAAAPPASAR